jgi:hypothetical protein
MESTASTLYELREDILQLKSYIEEHFSMELSTTLVEGEEK